MFDAIERAVPHASVPASPATTTDDSVFDVEDALARIEGDRELLIEVAGLFRRDCPKILEDIRDGISRCDASNLEREAHKLKGSLGALSARSAAVAAQKLEAIGKRGDLADAAA